MRCYAVEVVYPILLRALERLRERLPRTSRGWMRRVVQRLKWIRELNPHHYAVEGRPNLGDRRPIYYVWLEDGRQWRCTCQTAVWRRGVCTHIAAVMLYREYRRLLEKAERHVVYVAEAEVECPGRVEANGEVYIKPLGGWRYRVLVVSHLHSIKIRCGSYVVYEAEGEKTTYAAALAAAHRFTSKQI
jgi:hypothetical protein